MSTNTRIVNKETNQYNRGALAGLFALADLSNAGILTNVIISMPNRFKVVQKGNQLILKKGSTVTVPMGIFEQGTLRYDYVHISQDKVLEIDVDTIGEGPENYRYLVYNSVDNNLKLASTKFIPIPYPLTIDIVNNKITMYSSQDKVSVPFGYLDNNKIFHPFTSIGFYEDYIWTDKGLSLAIPDGRTDDYKLNIYNKYFNDLNIKKVTVNPVDGILLVDSAGDFTVVKDLAYVDTFTPSTGNVLTYVAEDNYIYDSAKNIKKMCKVAKVSVAGSNKLFSGLRDFNMYKATSYTDIKTDIESDVEAAFDQLRILLEDAEL